MKKQFITEAQRLQKLAGIITENVDFNKWSYNNNHGMEIVFNPTPGNPDGSLYDPEREEDLPSKKNFWQEVVFKFMDQIEQGFLGEVLYATKNSNGTWEFEWDAGSTSGFIEGEDFKFVPEEEL
jgi:hypothetical protein